MKKLLLALLAMASFLSVNAQQYALFGSKTMFDAFENPSQKSFTLDSSRKFSSNFFLPYFGVNSLNKGTSKYAIRKLTQEGVYDTKSLPIGNGELNHFYENSNIYVATFRMFISYKYQKELGLAWQIRSDSHIDYTNETLAIFDSYERFNPGVEYNDIFNTKGYQQTYHQFSVTYRENWDKRLAFGVKASLLSGIAYNKLDVSDSYLYLDPESDALQIGLAGVYSGSFSRTNELRKKTLIPTFKNPGLSLSFGTNYTTKKGLFLMANVKDLGFIWWRSNTHRTTVNQLTQIDDLAFNQSNTNEQIKDIFRLNEQSKKFLAPTNAKIDVYASRRYGFYKPALAISKSLFYKGGDVAVVNEFILNGLSAAVTPSYNFNDVFMVGLQGKYQSPNFEIFMGTDNLVATSFQGLGILNNDAAVGSGPNGASFYMGVGIKFGNVVNHPQFSDTMPGINDNEGGSFFKNLFSIFRRK
ncbi:hypothetical protein EZ449_12575 [Pedobacter frigidisoli]|uniref:DUF5723 domain-containing protein n=1 Tax=Pedobacter frigidisoli TaxID=2530455 RepID=A0A4R0P2L1_9SPHI|nr:DUF5723 family protein [Pedobacter frigidisoli]TCD08238.1 hypothetical protein EZ449_12575 [Pedobacter frigidisoli]